MASISRLHDNLAAYREEQKPYIRVQVPLQLGLWISIQESIDLWFGSRNRDLSTWTLEGRRNRRDTCVGATSEECCMPMKGSGISYVSLLSSTDFALFCRHKPDPRQLPTISDKPLPVVRTLGFYKELLEVWFWVSIPDFGTWTLWEILGDVIWNEAPPRHVLNSINMLAPPS